MIRKNMKNKIEKRKMMKRVFTGFILLAMVAVLMVGCSVDKTLDKETAKENVTVNEIRTKEIEQIVMCQSRDLFGSGNLTPVTQGGWEGVYYLANFYETLVNYEQGEIVPGLAETWEVNGNEITFKLKEGVKFSDGADFNAAVVKKNIEQIPELIGSVMSSTYSVLSKLKEVQVLDDYTVKLILKEPYYGALQELTMVWPMGMMSPHAFTSTGISAQVDSQTLGTGPYQLDSFVKGHQYTFIRNDHYWGEQPAIKQFIVKIIPDMASRIMALRAGEIDIIVGSNNITYDAFAEFADEQKFTAKVSDSIIKTNAVLLNTTRMPFNNKNVRLAVQHAIDKEVICDKILYGIEEKADALLSTELPYCDVVLEPYLYDPVKAKKLLTQAGWELPAGSDIRKKAGQSLEVELLFKSGVGMLEDLAMVVAEQLKTVGFKIKVTGVEGMSYFGRAVAGDFTILIYDTFGIPYDPQITINSMASQSWNQAAQEGVSVKPAIDAKVRELFTTIEDNKIQEHYDYILKTLHEEALYVPISYAKELVIFNNQLIEDYRFNGQPSNVDVIGIVPN